SYNAFFRAQLNYNGTTIIGESNRFNIFSQEGQYTIAKANENIDFKELYKSYRFQDTIANAPILFDDFIGSILGDIDSSPNTIGKRVYEKISNFVDNNS